MTSSLKREITGIGLLLFAIFIGASLLALGFAGSGGVVRENVGWVGWYLARPIVDFLGWPAAMLTPLVPAIHALRLFGRFSARSDRQWMIFAAGFALVLPIAIGVAMATPLGVTNSFTGVWGLLVAHYLRSWFGGIGAWVLVVLALSVLTAATLAWNPLRALVGIAPGRAEGPRGTAARVGWWPRAHVVGSSPLRTPATLALEPPPEELPGLVGGGVAVAPEEGSPAEPVDEPRRRKRKTAATSEREVGIANTIEEHTAPEDLVGDELPPFELLSPPPAHNADAGRRELEAMGAKLMDALRTFKVDGELVGRTTGPVVTQFEIEPAPGVKVRQIATLANDLALAMRAPSIRIVAPIPGRGAVGVEVPNPSAEIVALREILESREFQSPRLALPIALGKDLEGKPVIADLAKMPHLLIAGATGSGKSVCVNTIITSLVYRRTPAKLRFLMVDPKMVELSVYNTLPHLRHKVITDNRDAAAVLKWAVLEMNQRYELLAANGCRNVQDFNRRVVDGAPLRQVQAADVGLAPAPYHGAELPYLVIVIDEMADLMMTVQGEVETPIAMLAQKARATGIHLILATQRPSVNVITGLIKANFPSRIAFRVASQVDSRTIIDGAGAETLLGNGDMLFIPPGKSEPSRLQGAYLANEETEQLMKWYDDLRAAKRAAFEARGLAAAELTTSEPDILEEVRQREALDASAGDEEEVDAGDRDRLFREAAEVVIQNQNGSTSLLQRRLKVGYGRAARIIDQLEAAGILGPADASKAREVRVSLDALDHICGPRA